MCFALVVVQSLSRVRLFSTPRTAARQAFLSFIISRSLLRFTPTESVMLPNLCHPLLLLPSIFPSIRVFKSDFSLAPSSLTSVSLLTV